MMNKIKEYIAQLNEWNKAYDEGHPIVSDIEYDELYFKLVKLEKETGIYLEDSPTQHISYEVKNELEKVSHNHLMLSLDKTKDWNDFINYFGEKQVITMLKMDGLTCSLKYENGYLVSAETRGNGEIGEDILHNAKVISSIPKRIDYTDTLIIDGEVICKKDDFEDFKDEYKNPRNFASGSIRLLDSRECAKRKLTFVAWNIIEGFEDERYFSLKLDKLKTLGFVCVPSTAYLENAKEYLEVEAKLHNYPIDGLVGRFDDIQYGNSLGSTGHHSKAAYAFKFYDEEYDTELIDIEWSMGRTGVLTPVAIFKPVDDGESIIERASLHNLSVMYDTLHIPFVGQKIRVFKTNQIIPQISWAEEISEGGDINYPEVCPICGEKTIVKNNDGIKTLWCENSKCEGQLLNRIDHYCSKKGMDIRGLSKATIEKLIDKGWLNNVSDLYNLKANKSEWEKLPGFGKASVSKILDAIEESKNCRVENFISSLGIGLIGSTIAKEIVKYYPTWNEFREAIGGRWSDLDGFGYEMEKSLNSFDFTEADKIAESLNFKSAETANKNSISGLTFCITGKSSLGSRDKVKNIIEAAGGKVTGSVSGKTNYLVANAVENSSKYNNAIKYGVKIINDEDLINLIG